ncbi:MAG: DUF4258 domain-containing protein [Nitrospinae bacterium]|nr:DUF4258 domain-containing protein [Nitrospinota bacterium]
MVEGRLPKNPIEFVKRCISEGKVLWTYHVNMRMRNRHIPRHAIISSMASYEIIEAYPDDKYLPSYLVYARHEKAVIHILFGVDVYNENVRIITAYHPSTEQWSGGLKRRK